MTKLALLPLAAAATLGCIRAPDVVLVDRQTMLEEQLTGELQPLDDGLRELALVPTSVDFTRGQLEAAGVDLGDDTLNQVTRVHAVILSEHELLDDLLVRRCVGEANTGLLELTPATCSGRHNAQRSSASVHRVNRARRQLWQHLHDQQPSAPPEALRRRWREHHLRSVVCGGQVQREDGRWEVTSC
jgi:hypothetical protein